MPIRPWFAPTGGPVIEDLSAPIGTLNASCNVGADAWLAELVQDEQRRRLFPCWPAGPRMRCGVAVALPLTASSSQFCDWLIRGPLFCASTHEHDLHPGWRSIPHVAFAGSPLLDQVLANGPYSGLRAVRHADLS